MRAGIHCPRTRHPPPPAPRRARAGSAARLGAAWGLRETPAEELRRLERELAARLEDITRIQQLAAAGGADLTSAPVSEEIGRLRHEQARLVFRIDEIKKGVPNTERFLG